MKLSNRVTLTLSNKDFSALVADALAAQVFDYDHQHIVVDDIDYTDKGRWDIAFYISDGEEEE